MDSLVICLGYEAINSAASEVVNMVQSLRLIVFPVRDIDKASVFYSKLLGVEPYVSSPYYVGYKVGELELGLDPNS